MRIVSLVPSLTELVWWLGLGDALVGRTTFCTEPAGAIERVPRVGGTKNPKVAQIVGLAPDLVIANREENRREDVRALQDAGLDVLVTDPNTVREAVAMIREIGDRLDTRAKAEALATAIEAELHQVPGGEHPRVFVPIWKDPLMAMGGACYGHDLVSCAGGTNALGGRPRYPEVTIAEVRERAPDVVLVPDEPYPFKERDLGMFEEVAPARLIDGKALWWYGPRTPAALRFLRETFAEVGRRA